MRDIEPRNTCPKPVSIVLSLQLGRLECPKEEALVNLTPQRPNPSRGLRDVAAVQLWWHHRDASEGADYCDEDIPCLDGGPAIFMSDFR